MLDVDVNAPGKVYQRPWGTYRTLELNDGYQVKIICVKPDGRLSLQKHFKRAEHWIVIQGTPTVTVDHVVRDYQVNEHIFIPTESIHRLENFTDSEVVLIEVQIGTYLGEDDIIRLDDIYDRA